MRVIVAGSRGIADYDRVRSAIESSGFDVTELVCGMADGVDLLGKRWADERGIPVRKFPVTKDDWRATGKGAGHARNREMAAYGDALVLVWDGASSGSEGMLAEARLNGLRIYAPCPRCAGGCPRCAGSGQVLPPAPDPDDLS